MAEELLAGYKNHSNHQDLAAPRVLGGTMLCGKGQVVCVTKLHQRLLHNMAKHPATMSMEMVETVEISEGTTHNSPLLTMSAMSRTKPWRQSARKTPVLSKILTSLQLDLQTHSSNAPGIRYLQPCPCPSGMKEIRPITEIR
jgi:hypothetical protein